MSLIEPDNPPVATEPTTPKFSVIDKPEHYVSDGLEVIDVIDAFVESPVSAYHANVIKYVLRWRNKGGVEDLRKARWYLNRMIATLEG